MMGAVGRLEEEGVLIEDPAEANRLYNKGQLGTPRSGNSLWLTLVEAAYAVDAGRLEVAGLGLAEILAHGARAGERTEVEYLAYRDLRERGLVVRADGDAYAVWRRGEGTKKAPWFRSRPVSERAPVRIGELMDLAGDVLAIVDEDGAVTHYETAVEHLSGEVLPGQLDPMDGVLLDDRVLVEDPSAVFALAREAIGTRVGQRLVLSLTEAEALRRRGALRVPDGLEVHASQRQHHFPRTLPVYEALRNAGVVAKSGFKFGTHLRGYRRLPDADHAVWLIQCAFPDDVLHWSELSRAVRLAHGVRKTFCLAAAAPDGVRFVRLAWFRP